VANRESRRRSSKKSLSPTVALWLTAVLVSPVWAAAQDYKIGVYYFPGWKDNVPGAVYPLPWEKIKPFPEREPLLGWYTEGENAVMEQHLQWMRDYGIKFVAFDWYWIEANKPYLNHALDAYLQADNREHVHFALLWANHSPTRVPVSLEQWAILVRHWVGQYLRREEYFRLNGQPVVFVFDPERLENNARKLGSSSRELLATAQTIAREAGLPGIYFVCVNQANGPLASGQSAAMGYSALSAYNLHAAAVRNPFRRLSQSYAELDNVYRMDWEWMGANATLPYIVPMSSGWDMRPWGGSEDPLHDNSVGTPESFEEHLRAARDVMDKQPEAPKVGVICCWNEFGEGSYIEPTKKWQFRYLEKVKSVFTTGVAASAIIQRQLRAP
jgi:hypothetical protein